METRFIVGKNIKRLREAGGRSQGEVAREIGIDSSYLGRVERGEKNVGADTLLRIADGFGVAVDVLYNYDIGAKGEQDVVWRRLQGFYEPVMKLPEKKRIHFFSVMRQILEMIVSEPE